MDAFYASVEQLDNPQLRGKPLVVGGRPGTRGVVAAASYEARKFGIRSAMPMHQAVKRCPKLVIVPGRHSRYQDISQQIRQVFHRYTDLVEPLSLDEAYLDVTENKIGIQYASTIARYIRRDILAETGLTASAGVAPLKFLAKIASDINKPNGMTVIQPHEVDDFIARLPVKKIWGIGARTEEKMLSMGIVTGADLRAKSLDELRGRFGKMGQRYFDLSRGIDSRRVQTNRARKSIGKERTFAENISDLAHIHDEINRLSVAVFDSASSRQTKGRTVTLKIRYPDFRTITRRKTQITWFRSSEQLFDSALALLPDDVSHLSVRLLGVSLSGFETADQARRLASLGNSGDQLLLQNP